MEAINMKAMREALEVLRDAARDFLHQILNSKYNDIMDKYKCRERGLPALLDLRYAIPKANFALAAPLRNCDRFNSGDPVKDADDAYAEWQRQCEADDMPPSCKVESAFRQWLFATAKPETKGENDGK